MSKSLSYFMRNNTEEIVTVPGIKSFKDEDGNVLDFEIKKLSNARIRKIQNMYKKKSVATDKKGNPYIVNGEVAWKTERDSEKSLRHIMVEALVYPNLKDDELMKYYKCVDITDMPLHVFSGPDEFNEASRIVMVTLGMIDAPDIDEEKEEIKNS